MADNADFEFSTGIGSVIVGAEVTGGPGGRVGLFTHEGYPDGSTAGSWRLGEAHNAGDPGGNPREVHWNIRRGAFGWTGCAGSNYAYPYETTVFAGRFENGTDASYRNAYSESATVNQYCYCNGSTTDDSTSRIRIAAEGHIAGPDYAAAEFTGKIFFALWVDGYVYSYADLVYIRDNDLQPYEICDPDTYDMMYIDFCQDVAATVTADVQSGPNAPYTFNVYGTPVKNGGP